MTLNFGFGLSKMLVGGGLVGWLVGGWVELFFFCQPNSKPSDFMNLNLGFGLQDQQYAISVVYHQSL